MQEQRRVLNAMALLVALVLCLAAAPVCQAAEKTTIEEACLKAAEAASSRSKEGGEAASIYYEQCVRSLSSDRRSRDAADLHTLAAVAARMAVEHASATEARMKGLSEAEESPHARARLRHCLDLYAAAADVLRDALDNVRARVYGKAAQQLAAAETCEDVWKGEDHVPVAGHDREYGRIALLALGLTTGIVTTA